MFSSTAIMIFGAILVAAVGFVVWRWWSSKSAPVAEVETAQVTSPLFDEPRTVPKDPPPMLFADNDMGHLEFLDMSGKLIKNSGFDDNTYLNLISQASKDVSQTVGEDGAVSFISTVGTTKLYYVGKNPFLINYTRLV